MPRRVYSISIVIHAFCVMAASASWADGPSAGPSDDERWIPSWALVLGFTSQEQHGAIESNDFPLGFGFPFARELRPDVDSDNFLTLIHIGGSLALETPRLGRFGPRLFVEGEVLNVSSQRRRLAGEGKPGPIVEPVVPGNQFSDLGISGQGSEITSDARNVQYGASLGLSYPFRIGDLRFSIRPSARYLNQKFYFTGFLVDAFRPFGPGPTRVVSFRGSKSLDVHAVGPGLELELEVARMRSISGSFFVSGGAYRVLSDRDVTFRTRGRDNLNVFDTEVVWSAEIEPWIYRGSLGFRFRWLGIPPGWLGQR